MATVYYFTSTGNSLYYAKKLSTALNAECVPMKEEKTVCNDSVIGFIFPTFFFDLPKTVETFLKNLVITEKNPYIFSVTTYGDNVVGVNGKVDKILKEKGYSCTYAENVKCVENYLPMYTINDTEEVQAKSDDMIEVVIAELLLRKQKMPKKYGVLNRLVSMRYPAKKSGSCDQFFTVEGCIGCGICSKVCTRKNITMVEEKPSFGGNCELCLACLHACPKDAINWKNTKGKKHYRNPHVTLQEIEESKQS